MKKRTIGLRKLEIKKTSISELQSSKIIGGDATQFCVPTDGPQPSDICSHLNQCTPPATDRCTARICVTVLCHSRDFYVSQCCV